MALKRFVEAARRKDPEEEYRELQELADIVPGTTKIRTYATSSFLYSEESSLEKIFSWLKEEEADRDE